MNKDMDAQFLCKDCARYNQCEYYHRRKKDSYICKYFHLSETPKTGHWITRKGHIECSVCGFRFNVPKGYTLDDVSHNYCPNCGKGMLDPQESEEK